MLAANSVAITPDDASRNVAFWSDDLPSEVEAIFAPGTSAEYMARFEHVHHQDGGYCAGCAGGSRKLGPAALGEQSGTTGLAAYQANRRWSNTATDGAGLDWGEATTLTWSIVPDGTPIPGYVGEPSGASNFISFMSSLYDSASNLVGGSAVGAAEQPWFSTVASVFERWSEVSGLNFVYEPHDDGAAFSNIASTAPGVAGVRGDIRIGGHAIDGDSGTLAYNFFPNNGEMILDTSDSFFTDTSDDSLRLRNVMAHELGHGIGLSHVDPVDQTKLMEPFASTAFDGLQHDDILATHRMYGDQFEAGSGNNDFPTAVDLGELSQRSVSVGDDAAKQYVSIDGAGDVDYFRFTADAGATLDSLLVPLGYEYQQGAVNSGTSSFDSKAQNNLSLEIYDANYQRLGQADSSGLGGSEMLTGVTLSATGPYFVRVSGDRDAAQLYQLDLSVSAGGPDGAINFQDYTIDTYGGSQDHSGSVVVENGGAALHLTGNRWKMIDFPYTVTPNTMLEFDFSSTAQGDIHGIGFDSNTSISSGLTFRLYGTQAWGLDDFVLEEASSSGDHFVIPVGRFYTGKATALVFVNDHDVSNPDAESIFRNVRIYESVDRGDSPAVPAPQAVNDRIVVNEDSPTVAFHALANDEGGGAELSITEVSGGSAGAVVSVADDGWIHYRPVANYNGTETFTYTVASTGGTSTATVTATVRPVNDPPVASNDRYSVTAGRSYRLNVLKNDSIGVDSDESLAIISVGKGSAGGKITTDRSRITYTPAAGFTGTESFTYTINDGTPGSNDTATVTVRVDPSEPKSVDFRNYEIEPYGGNQDVVGAALVENNGSALRLLGNTWKKIKVPYTITPDTVLEFDFASTSQGDIHGIGLDNNSTITSSRTFRLHGSQDWGIGEFDSYESSSGTKHYVIPIGKYYTGPMEYLFFTNDHDVRNPTAESLFQDVRLYETSKSAASTAANDCSVEHDRIVSLDQFFTNLGQK